MFLQQIKKGNGCSEWILLQDVHINPFASHQHMGTHVAAPFKCGFCVGYSEVYMPFAEKP